MQKLAEGGSWPTRAPGEACAGPVLAGETGFSDLLLYRTSGAQGEDWCLACVQPGDGGGSR